MDRAQLADFLRTRREALQPEDVGMPRSQRRRTGGLRREEVAALCQMSTDYYTRIEQQRGPRPSEQMLASIARGLHLSVDERDHLFRLAGHAVPQRGSHSDHVSPGLMRILARLDDTPAQVIGELGETLVQTRLARALLGDHRQYDGLERYTVYRWFTDPAFRALHVAEDHDRHGRVFTSMLRAAYAREVSLGVADGRAARLVQALLATGSSFTGIWEAHEVGLRWTGEKRFVHPEVGELSLHCQTLQDPDAEQRLLVFTATPGSERHEKLALLGVIATDYSAISNQTVLP